MQFRQLIIFLVVLFFIATVFVPVGAGLASPGDDTSASPLERGNGQPATIDSALEDTSGEVEVVLRFTERSPGAIRTTAAENQPAAMRTHAANTQSPFLQFAEGNPHIEITSQLWLANAVVVTVDTDRIPLERLAERQNVERIHENYAVHAVGAATAGGTQSGESAQSLAQTQSPSMPLSTTSEPSVTRALSYSNVPAAWDTYNTRGEGVRVAVIDTGVNPDHPDIDIDSENWYCAETDDDVADCDSNPSGPHDNDGHGTHVSGTIVGGNANDAGLHIGVAPEATLMHAKGMGDNGGGNFNSITKSMQWAVDNDADILSMSLGADGKSSGLIDPVQNAQASGTVVIAAIGNNGAETSGSPGNIYDAIAVGSVDVEPAFPSNRDFGLEDGKVSTFSGGETISKDEFSNPPAEWPDSYIVPDITATGSIIWSANNNDDHEIEICDDAPTNDLTCLAGTSMATPHVAGTAALMQSATAAQLTPEEIKTALTDTAWKPDGEADGQDDRYGFGIVDAHASVGAVTTPTFDVSELTAPEQLTTNESYTVTATVTNTGDLGTEDIQYRLEDDANTVILSTQTERTLDAGESTDVQFSVSGDDTADLDGGSYTHVLASESTQVTASVEIVKPAGSVRIDDQTTTGETIEIADASYNMADFVVVLQSEPDSAHEDNVIGVTDRVAAGEQLSSETVTLSEPLETNQTVYATLYGVDEAGEYDVPVEIAGSLVRDHANVTVSEDTTHPSGVSQAQFTAVAGDDGTLTQTELSIGINEWFYNTDNTINGIVFSQDELSGLINWWFEN